MIGWLRGRLVEKHPDRLIVDVGGVGYEVHVPLSTFYTLPEPGARVELRIRTHVREDQIALFGFSAALEQQLFDRLIGVSGIGPRLALAVLSGIEPDDLVRAVRAADIARLTGIPGIGKKTAERIVLELKDKLPAGAAPVPAGAVPAPAASDQRADLISALVNLGYQRQAAERAVDAALEALGPGAAFEAALRQALRGLSR
jgi:Holliday junction DNA helicase RuvA